MVLMETTSSLAISRAERPAGAALCTLLALAAFAGACVCQERARGRLLTDQQARQQAHAPGTMHSLSLALVALAGGGGERGPGLPAQRAGNIAPLRRVERIGAAVQRLRSVALAYRQSAQAA